MTVIGVDMGGTWLRAAAAGPEGLLTDVRRVPTGSHRPAEAVVADLVDLVDMVSQMAPAVSVGVGVPTTFTADGALSASPNLPNMSGYPLRRELEARLGRSVWLENDARCFALGEWRWGQGAGCGVMVGVTLGTSVGLGIVIGGSIFAGGHGEAGEVFRSPLDVESPRTTGRDLHSALAGAALERAYHRRTGTVLAAAAVGRAARAGDTAARACFEDYGRVVGGALQWICNILDPEVVVLGGAGAADYDLFRPSLELVFGNPQVQITPSRLGERAAILGAATVALMEVQAQ